VKLVQALAEAVVLEVAVHVATSVAAVVMAAAVETVGNCIIYRIEKGAYAPFFITLFQPIVSL
jgi:hypothetical protein